MWFFYKNISLLKQQVSCEGQLSSKRGWNEHPLRSNYVNDGPPRPSPLFWSFGSNHKSNRSNHIPHPHLHPYNTKTLLLDILLLCVCVCGGCVCVYIYDLPKIITDNFFASSDNFFTSSDNYSKINESPYLTVTYKLPYYFFSFLGFYFVVLQIQ